MSRDEDRSRGPIEMLLERPAGGGALRVTGPVVPDEFGCHATGTERGESGRDG